MHVGNESMILKPDCRVPLTNILINFSTEISKYRERRKNSRNPVDIFALRGVEVVTRGSGGEGRDVE